NGGWPWVIGGLPLLCAAVGARSRVVWGAPEPLSDRRCMPMSVRSVCFGRVGGGSGSVEDPATVWSVGDAEGGEAGKVGRGGEEVEVSGDTGLAAHAGAAAAVAAAHQVGDLAFDFRSGGAVVGSPGRIGLPGTGSRQMRFPAADGDTAT